MFVWHIHAAVECKSSSEMAYRLWTDVSHWQQWDQEIEWARLDGSFVVGAMGTIQFRDLGAVRFRVAYVEKNRRFSIVVKKFLTTIACTCEITQSSDKKVQLTERIIVGGMLAPIYKRFWGKNLQKSLPQALRCLTELLDRHV